MIDTLLQFLGNATDDERADFSRGLIIGGAIGALFALAVAVLFVLSSAL
jgi:hypothetical protein